MQIHIGSALLAVALWPLTIAEDILSAPASSTSTGERW
jgi:hypothetical protein